SKMKGLFLKNLLEFKVELSIARILLRCIIGVFALKYAKNNNRKLPLHCPFSSERLSPLFGIISSYNQSYD
ncbi:12794_t:CDS:2, partial [Funneliformis caledonium]